MNKPFTGFCFTCQYKSNIKDEFFTRAICLPCRKDYFKLYMRDYNKIEGHYRYKNNWKLTMSNLPIGLIL